MGNQGWLVSVNISIIGIECKVHANVPFDQEV